MPAVKTRRAYRPLVENLETYCLLSALPVNPPATVHQASIVNLMGTQVDRDAYNIISQASPHFAQRNFQITMLNVDSNTRMVRGVATASYGVQFLGSLKGTIQFKTSLDSPRPQDVKFTISQFSSLITGASKRQVQQAVVNFINRDRAAIEAQFPTTS